MSEIYEFNSLLVGGEGGPKETRLEYVYSFTTTKDSGELTISVRDLGAIDIVRSMSINKRFLEDLILFLDQPEFLGSTPSKFFKQQKPN